MSMRTILATAVTAAALAAGAGPAVGAPSAAHVVRSCGTMPAGGKSWRVAVTVVSCPSARKLVRKLAARPHPGAVYHYPGTFLGMGCTSFTKGTRTLVQCVGKRGQSVLAQTR
jgi:hypothetical protein